jgi:hypothetical protein
MHGQIRKQRARYVKIQRQNWIQRCVVFLDFFLVKKDAGGGFVAEELVP